MNKPTRPRVLYVSHGGGPLPLLGDPDHQEMVVQLRAAAAEIGKPSAILLVSAHWEEQVPTLTAGANPPLIYDYYGFPEQAYQVQYPAPGHPALARQAFDLLRAGGMAAALDEQRGFDHGLFVPLKIMYPAADVPCVQLSLVAGLDPQAHVRAGAALSGLADGDLLVVGSGFSFHNMHAFFAPDSSQGRAMNEAFEAWLIDTCSNYELDESTRSGRLVHWEQAPFARYCHPREEHLMPLHVCYGLAGRASSAFCELNILRKKCSFYLW